MAPYVDIDLGQCWPRLWQRALNHYLKQCWPIINEGVVAFTWGQLHRKLSRYLSLVLVWILLIHDHCRIPQPMNWYNHYLQLLVLINALWEYQKRRHLVKIELSVIRNFLRLNWHHCNAWWWQATITCFFVPMIYQLSRVPCKMYLEVWALIDYKIHVGLSHVNKYVSLCTTQYLYLKFMPG